MYCTMQRIPSQKHGSKRHWMLNRDGVSGRLKETFSIYNSNLAEILKMRAAAGRANAPLGWHCFEPQAECGLVVIGYP